MISSLKLADARAYIIYHATDLMADGQWRTPSS